MKFAADSIDPAKIAGNKYIGQPVPRLEDPPLVTGRGRFAGDISFPHQLHMRIARRAGRPWQDRRHRHRAGAGAAGGRRGVDRRRHRRRAADRFPRRPHRAAGAVPPAGARDRPRALCRRARRRGVRRRSLRRGGRRRPRRHRHRRIAGAARRRCGARRVLARPQHRADHRAPGLWRRRRRVRARRDRGRTRSLRSAATAACRWRRAAPSAATTPRATFSNCTAPPRCRTATATCSPTCSGAARRRSMSTRPMSAAASAFAARSIPRTCWSASPRCGSGAR